MPHHVTPPAFIIGFGILLIAGGLLPLRLWRVWSRPIFGQLLLIISGLLILVAIDPITAFIQPVIESGTDKLPNVLYAALGPVGVIIEGFVLTAFIVTILIYRLNRYKATPFGVQHQPRSRQGDPK